MPSLLPPGAGLLVIWYSFLVYLAVLVGAVAALWIHFDAERKGREARTLLALALICVILMLPSFLLALLPDLMITYPDLVVPMGYMGLLGGLGTILIALAYAMVRPGPEMPRVGS